jgi:hypothetical protein
MILALAQVALLYAAYLVKGLQAGTGARAPVFSAVHTMKQLAQLLGTMVGLGKLI